MGTLRFWLLLVAAMIVVLIALFAAGPITAATPSLRYAGYASLAVIFVSVPPIVIKLFIAGQAKSGNGALPGVRFLQRIEPRIVIGVWALIAVALLLALPRIRADIAADRPLIMAIADAVSMNPTALLAQADVADSATTTPIAAEGTPSGASSMTPAQTNASNAPASAAAHTLQQPVTTPGAGSPTRKAILDAVRQRLKITTQFKVDHIRVSGRWAFVRATEVVELDKGELQETDLTVAALLELPAATRAWRVVDLWTLPDDQTHPFAKFIRHVRELMTREKLPAALLPGDI